jgi:hypothetical protein
MQGTMIITLHGYGKKKKLVGQVMEHPTHQQPK